MKRKPKKKPARKPKKVARAPKQPVYADTDIVCRIQNYGGNDAAEVNGTVVRVGDYHPTTMFFIGYTQNDKGDILYLRPSELEPLTPAARKHVEEQVLKPPVIYPNSVYDLRDDLAAIGIYVTAEAVAKWTPQQHARITAYVGLVAAGAQNLAAPEELKR